LLDWAEHEISMGRTDPALRRIDTAVEALGDLDLPAARARAERLRSSLT
jgi:hypothetical protein